MNTLAEKTDIENAIINIWDGFRRAYEPFSFKRFINGVSVEVYVFNQLEALNTGKVINPALVVMIEKYCDESYYSLSKISIPSSWSCYNYKNSDEKHKIEYFIISKLKLRDFSKPANVFGLGLGHDNLVIYVKFYMLMHDAIDLNYTNKSSIRNLENRYINFIHRLTYYEGTPRTPRRYGISDDSVSLLRKVAENHRVKNFEGIPVKEILKDNALAESLQDNILTFFRSIPIDWKFFCDLKKMESHISLQDDYTWYANAPIKHVSNNGVEKTINPRKEFFYAFPNFGAIHLMVRELETAIDSGEKMIPALVSYFDNKVSPSSIKTTAQTRLLILQRKMSGYSAHKEEMAQHLIFLDKLPKKMKDMVRHYNDYDIVEQKVISVSFCVIIRFFHVYDYAVVKEKGDLIDFSMKISFQALGVNPKDVSENTKSEIVEAIKSLKKISDKDNLNPGFIKDVMELMLLDIYNKTNDLMSDALSLFAARVLLPIALHIGKLNDIDVPNTVMFFGRNCALSFLLHDCKKSIHELFYINKVVHDERDWFALAGTGKDSIKCLTDDELKENEGKLHEAFNVIRSDKYRVALNLDKHADWMTLISESHTDKDTGYVFVPMLSRYDLIKEGQAMNNCVGRFGYDVKSAAGMCRIFTVLDSDNKRVTTLEIGINSESKTVSLDQIQGYSNRGLIAEAKEATKEFIEDINNGKIKSNWDNVLETTETGSQLAKSGAKEGQRSFYLSDRAGYDVMDINQIRVAAEPWRQFMPKKYRDFDIESFKDICRIDELISNIKYGHR